MARKKTPQARPVPKIINDGAEIVPADQVSLHPRNVNAGDLGAIIESMAVHGFYGRLIVQRSTGHIIAGNHRFMAGVELGMTEFPVEYVDVSDDIAIRLLLTDNRTTRLGMDDPAKLAELLKELQATDLGLLGTAFDGDDLDQLLSDLGELTTSGGGGLLPDADPDAIPDDAPTRCAPGQYWACGDSKLFVGDSTDAGGVALMFGEERADVCATDPPYGVNYVGKTKAAKTIQNDGADGLPALLAGAFKVADALLKPGSPIYVAHPAGAPSLVFGAELSKIFKIHQQLIWLKNSMVLGHSDYHYIHEPIWLCYKASEEGTGRNGRGGDRWYGDNSQVSVIPVDRPSRSEEHRTMKPTALYVKLLANSCPAGGLVYEPFGGSGTTLIAAESLGMRCFAVELDPKFADVILARFEQATGKTARLIDGQA